MTSVFVLFDACSFSEIRMEVVPIRAEVIEAHLSRKAGAIVLARPMPMKVAAGCGGAVVVALALLLGFGEYTSKVRVTGQLVTADGAIKVVGAQFGRISGSNSPNIPFPIPDGCVVVPGGLACTIGGRTTPARFRRWCRPRPRRKSRSTGPESTGIGGAA
jgi:hypothetical protein